MEATVPITQFPSGAGGAPCLLYVTAPFGTVRCGHVSEAKHICESITR